MYKLSVGVLVTCTLLCFTSLNVMAIDRPAKGSAKYSQTVVDRLNTSRTRSNKGVNDVLVNVVFFKLDNQLIQLLKQNGIQVTAYSEKYNQASLLISSTSELNFVSSLAEVQRISSPFKRQTRAGSVSNEALQALKISSLHLAPHNLTGEGVTIGVISDSIARTDLVRTETTSPAPCSAGLLRNTAPQLSGDLPDVITVLNDNAGSDCGDSEIDEGTAMAELIHDIAPGAGIVFHTAGNSTVEYAMAVDRLCSDALNGGAGVDIVVDDIFFPNQLKYQDDIVAQAAAECVQRGVHYFTAVGNDGDAAYRQIYTDIDPQNNRAATSDVVTSQDLHKWSDGSGFLAIDLDPEESFQAILHWNQPALSAQRIKSRAPDIDLDMYLFANAQIFGRPLAASEEPQDGTRFSADPLEIISYTNETNQIETVYLAINHWRGNKQVIPQNNQERLEFSLLLLEGGTPEYSIPFNGTTVFGHVNAAGVHSIAAVPWWDTPQYDVRFNPTAVMDPESYTARGGQITKPFDKDGIYSPTTVYSPSYAAVDGSSTTFFGEALDLGGAYGEPNSTLNFFGTSAAAPNAAAGAALILQAGQTAQSPVALKQLLQATAVDVTGQRAAVGQDDVSGFGLMDVTAAVAQLPTVNALEDVVVGAGTNIELTVSGTAAATKSIVKYRLRSKSSALRIDLESTDGQFNFYAPTFSGSYPLEYQVVDSAGLASGRIVNLIVNDDSAILVDAGKDVSAMLNDRLTLMATTRGAVAESFTWSHVSGPAIQIQNPNSNTVSVLFTEPGVYEFKVLVTSQFGNSEDTVRVTVLPKLNVLISASMVTGILEGDSVQFTANISNQLQSDLVYQWQVAMASDVMNSNSETLNYTFQKVGDYRISLTLTADDGRSASASMQVSVAKRPVSGSPDEHNDSDQEAEGNRSLQLSGESGGSLPGWWVILITLFLRFTKTHQRRA